MGLTAVAVTDHDTVDGLPEALAAGERLGIEVVPGVEINLEHERVTMDMLGYFLGGCPSDELEARARRAARATATSATRACSSGWPSSAMPLDPSDLAAAAENGAVGRPHIGEAMVRRGYVSSISEAFELFLRRGAPAWVDRRRLALGAALRLLRASRRPAGAGPPRHHPHRRRRPRAHRPRRRPRRASPASSATTRCTTRRRWRACLALAQQVRARAHRRLRLPRRGQAQGAPGRRLRRRGRSRTSVLDGPALRRRRPARRLG